MRLSPGLADCSSAESRRDTNPVHTLINTHSICPPLTRAHKYLFFLILSRSTKEKSHLAFSLSPAHAKIINAPPSGLGCADVQERIGSSTKDNKQGTALCFTAIKTHPIWHALWCLQNPSKTSSYSIRFNRARCETRVLRAFRCEKIQPPSYARPISYSQRYSQC